MQKHSPLSLFIRQALLYPLDSPFLPPENKVEAGFKYANDRLFGTLEPEAALHYPGDQQFIDNQDGTITDLSTGLMWPKLGNAEGGNMGNTLDHDDAVAWANGLNFAGHQDWRLPTIKELQTLLDYTYINPAMNQLFFESFNTFAYWSITDYLLDPNMAWYSHFGNGFVYFSDRDNLNAVVAVRNI